jgi:hypothetical protein
MKKIESSVQGTRLTVGRAADQNPTAQGPVQGPSPGAATSNVEKLAQQREVDVLARQVAGHNTQLVVEFSTSPIGADAAARLFSELLKSDATDIVGLTQYLSALGVQVGYQGTAIGHFAGISHRMPSVQFPPPESRPPETLQAYMKIQELDAATKQMAIKLQKDQGPQNLRSFKQQAVFNAHALAEIWRRAPDFDAKGDLQRSALQALKNVAELQGRVQFAMQDFVEGTKRGMGLPTEGAQPLLDPKDGELIFRNSLRLGRIELDPAVRQDELDKKFQKALKKGVKASDIEEMSPEFLKKTPHGARFEYVLVPKTEAEPAKLRVTLNEAAGHSTLAGIDPRITATGVPDAERKLEDNFGGAAGGPRSLRANDGTQIVLADPKSGHYRAPTQLTAERLTPFLTEAGVPRENVIVTAGDPLDTGEILAIDVWVYKAANNNELPKEVGDKFYEDSVKLYGEAVAHGAAVANAVLGPEAPRTEQAGG